MAYAARKLVTRAFNLSGVISRELQTLEGDQAAEGLELLNDLLAENSTDTRLIPYFKKTEFNVVVGQEEYLVENLLYPETVTFNMNEIRFSMSIQGRKQYFGSARANNINSLLSTAHFERELGGSRLYLYFKPSAAYPVTIWGKFGLEEVASLEEDLSLVYDRFYRNYLKYSLAGYICDEYNITFQNQDKLLVLEKKLFDLSPIDVSVNKIDLYGPNIDIFGYANLGRGFIPGA
jgi:hypothetical protein